MNSETHTSNIEPVEKTDYLGKSRTNKPENVSGIPKRELVGSTIAIWKSAFTIIGGMASENLYRIVAVALLVLCVSLVALSYGTGGIAATLLSPEGDAEAKILALQQFFAELGGWAPAAYILMVVIEVVVAPLPGTLLYMPGGIIFGGFYGGLWSWIANILGAGISCQLMRSIVGRKSTESFFQRESLTKYRDMIEQKGLWLIVLLRVNPLTSSDIVSYAAGLTTMRTRSVMLGTGIGMAPLCFAQSYLAETLFDTFPWLIWPMLFACIVYVIVIAMIIWNLRNRSSSQDTVADTTQTDS